MVKEDFETIKTKLEERIEGCRQRLDKITDKESIGNLSANDLLDLKKFCDEEVDIQTRILMVDLYHVIGMGNLSAIQLSTFSKLVKDYSSYRPDIKAISKWDASLLQLPKVPKKTLFRLLELGITVTSGRGDIQDAYEEEEGVDEYTKTKLVKEESLPSPEPGVNAFYKGGKLFVKEEAIEKVVDHLRKNSAFNSGNRDKYIKSIQSGTSYCGIDWTYDITTKLYVGTCQSNLNKPFKAACAGVQKL